MSTVIDTVAASEVLAVLKVQRASGQSGTAYRVRDEAGEERWVRSPQRRFERGQQVDLRQGRLYPH